MDACVLPNELLCSIAEHLPRRDIASFRRTYWGCCELLEYPLFRLHAFPERSQHTVRAQMRPTQDSPPDALPPKTPICLAPLSDENKTAVIRAVEMADPEKPDTQAWALALLGKVDRFCFSDRPGDTPSLDGFYKSDHFLSTSRECGLLVTALVEATAKGLYDIVVWLLSHGADPNTHTYMVDGRLEPDTALSLAVERNDTPIVRLLLDHGAGLILAYSSLGIFSVGHVALTNGKTEQMELLLAYAGQHGMQAIIQADDLLDFYNERIGRDIPGVVALLLRHITMTPQGRYNLFRDLIRYGKPMSSLEVLETLPAIPGRQLELPEALFMLELACRYNRNHSDEQQQAKLAILRRLLQYGVSIDTPASEHAAMPTPVPSRLPGRDGQERVRQLDFSYAVCQELLDYRRKMPPSDEADVYWTRFVDSYEKARRTGKGVFAVTRPDSPASSASMYLYSVIDMIWSK